MPKSKGRKTTKQSKSPRPTPPTKPSWWARHWKFVSAIAASVSGLVGFAAAVAAFLPRVTIDVGDPIEPSNAFSAPVLVSNNFVSLERATLSLGICKIIWGGGAPGVGATLQSERGDCNAGSRVLISPPEAGHHFGSDDKWRVLLKDFVNPPKFQGGDITMVIQYSPWPLSYLHVDHWPLRFEKQFRFRARPDGNGTWQWFPTTIDEPY